MNPQLWYFYSFNTTNCSCFNYFFFFFFYEETSSLLAVTFTMVFLGQIQIVNLFLPELGHLVTEENIYWSLRQEVRFLLEEGNYRYMHTQAGVMTYKMRKICS